MEKTGGTADLFPKCAVELGHILDRHRSKEGSDMLVLSRKLGEKIYISDNICITVVDIDRGKIRLGIEAPRDVPIFRQELLAERPAAASTNTPVSAKS
jgi:carbon storage regulator